MRAKRAKNFGYGGGPMARWGGTDNFLDGGGQAFMGGDKGPMGGDRRVIRDKIWKYIK